VVDPVASKLVNKGMEQDYSVEADSHLTAQIILHLRRHLKALYCSEELETIGCSYKIFANIVFHYS
jgi:hypothetical protein